MAAEAPGENDLSDDIITVESYDLPSPPPKEFLPWHLPRKQFVRKHQWCEQISRLLDEDPKLHPQEGTLKYFGLPGSDLIDLRCFRERICVPRGLRLRYLGFNSAAAPDNSQQTDMSISKDELDKLDNIDPTSEILPDDFRNVSQEASIAFGKIKHFGAFDVVNLDLCDSITSEQSGLFGENYYNAMSRLLGFQARKKGPWLLLLTTLVGSKHVHQDTMSTWNLQI